MCGSQRYLERHHIFGAANRKYSEKYGLTVHLCWNHHQDSKTGVHHNPELMQQLHEEGQRAFEKIHTRADFLKIFGKNYLDERDGGELPWQQEEAWGFIFLPEES